MSNEVQSVDKDNFDQVVMRGEGPIVVEFMSYSCEHCRLLAPVLEQVAKMVKQKEKIYQVNMATNQELGDRYNIQSTPTLLMFYQGREVGEVIGPKPSVASLLTAVAQPFRSLL